MREKEGVFVKNLQKRLVSLVFSLVLCLGFALPVQAASSNYKITGNGANDIVSVACAQNGLGGSAFGFPSGYAWCAYFTCWAGRTAGCNFPTSNLGTPRDVARWFVNNNAGTFYYFRDENYTDLCNSGKVSNKKLCVKSNRNSFKPQKGDLVCYLWTSDKNDGYNWSHIGIVTADYKGNGTIATVEGNSGNVTTADNGTVGKFSRKYNAEIIGFIRPNYSKASPSTQTTQNKTQSSSKVSVKTGKYYTLKNVGTGKYLNIYGNQNKNNANVDIYAADGTSGQDFMWTLIDKSKNSYTLTPRCATSRRVNVYGESAKNKANVCLWSKTNHSTQCWIPEKVSGGYILRCANNTSYVLMATGSKNSSNVNIQKYSSGNKNQVWTSSALS